MTATLTHLGPQDPKMSITYLLLLLLLLLTFFFVFPSIVPKTPKAQNIHFSLGNLHGFDKSVRVAVRVEGKQLRFRGLQDAFLDSYKGL